MSSQINDVNVGHQRPIMPFKAISGDEWNLSLTAPSARAVLHINVMKNGNDDEFDQLDEFGTK